MLDPSESPGRRHSPRQERRHSCVRREAFGPPLSGPCVHAQDVEVSGHMPMSATRHAGAPSSTGMHQRWVLELVPNKSDEKMRRGAGSFFRFSADQFLSNTTTTTDI